MDDFNGESQRKDNLFEMHLGAGQGWGGGAGSR